MANRYGGRYTASHVTRELQMKSTAHYRNSQSLKHWKSQTLVRAWSEMILFITEENSKWDCRWFLTKLHLHMLVVLLSIYPKDFGNMLTLNDKQNQCLKELSSKFTTCASNQGTLEVSGPITVVWPFKRVLEMLKQWVSRLWRDMEEAYWVLWHERSLGENAT